MTSIGALEAQNTLPELLQRVAQGEEFLITDEGEPVAKLVPACDAKRPDVRRVIEAFKAYSRRQGRTLAGLTPHDLVEEGRRY